MVATLKIIRKLLVKLSKSASYNFMIQFFENFERSDPMK